MGRRIIYKSDTVSGKRDILLNKILKITWTQRLSDFIKKYFQNDN